jgi:hypothetical protein
LQLQHSRTGVAHVQQVIWELQHRRWQLLVVLVLLLWCCQLKLLVLLMSCQLILLVLLQVRLGVWRWWRGMLVQRRQLLLLGRMALLQLLQQSPRHRDIQRSTCLEPWGRYLAAPLLQQLLRLRHLLRRLRLRACSWQHPLRHHVTQRLLLLLLLLLGSLKLLQLLFMQQLLVAYGLQLPRQLPHGGPVVGVELHAGLQQEAPLWLTPLGDVQVQVAAHEAQQDLLGRKVLKGDRV